MKNATRYNPIVVWQVKYISCYINNNKNHSNNTKIFYFILKAINQVILKVPHNAKLLHLVQTSLLLVNYSAYETKNSSKCKTASSKSAAPPKTTLKPCKKTAANTWAKPITPNAKATASTTSPKAKSMQATGTLTPWPATASTSSMQVNSTKAKYSKALNKEKDRIIIGMGIIMKESGGMMWRRGRGSCFVFRVERCIREGFRAIVGVGRAVFCMWLGGSLWGCLVRESRRDRGVFIRVGEGWRSRVDGLMIRWTNMLRYFFKMEISTKDKS